jgi:hypothetical protein
VPGGDEVTLQVDVDDRVPVGLGHVDQDPVPQDAGVVDQDVEVAEGLDGGVDQPLAALPVADVVGVGHRLAAGGGDLVHHLLGRRPVVPRPVHRAAQVVDHHAWPLRPRRAGRAPADAATGPGDDRDASVQCSHVNPPCLRPLRRLADPE